MENLDKNCLELLQTIQDLHEKKLQFQTLLNNGYLHMSKARYIMGANSVTPLQYSPAMAAKTTVDVDFSQSEFPTFIANSWKNEPKTTSRPDRGHSPQDEDSRNQEAQKVRSRKDTKIQDDSSEGVESLGASLSKVDLDDEDDKDDALASRDPLNWFGVLVPQSLRECQSQFIRAALLASDICTLQCRLENLEKKQKNLVGVAFSKSDEAE